MEKNITCPVLISKDYSQTSAKRISVGYDLNQQIGLVRSIKDGAFQSLMSIIDDNPDGWSTEAKTFKGHATSVGSAYAAINSGPKGKNDLDKLIDQYSPDRIISLDTYAFFSPESVRRYNGNLPQQSDVTNSNQIGLIGIHPGHLSRDGGLWGTLRQFINEKLKVGDKIEGSIHALGASVDAGNIVGNTVFINITDGASLYEIRHALYLAICKNFIDHHLENFIEGKLMPNWHPSAQHNLDPTPEQVGDFLSDSGYQLARSQELLQPFHAFCSEGRSISKLIKEITEIDKNAARSLQQVSDSLVGVTNSGSSELLQQMLRSQTMWQPSASH